MIRIRFRRNFRNEISPGNFIFRLRELEIMEFEYFINPDNWEEQFEIARKGAFPALTKLRDEGVIKAWGLGVNSPEPILKLMDVADAGPGARCGATGVLTGVPSSAGAFTNCLRYPVTFTTY